MCTVGRILFVIPARGGSKGVVGKNLRPVGGIPLVARSIRVAREVADRFPDAGHVVLCSTDDRSIAEEARAWGAQVPFLRPAHLAGDDSPTLGAVLHALSQLGADRFDVVVVLQPTSPLLCAEDLSGALDLHARAGAPVVTVSSVEHPIAWQFTLDDGGRLRSVVEGERPLRRQDAAARVQLNGAAYIASRAQVMSGEGFLCAETLGYVMPASRSVDIDSPHDLDVAESLIASREPAAVTVGGRVVGHGHPCFVIAEAGVNHNGDLGLALELVDVAAECGADAVKFQTFRASRLAGRDTPKAEYQKRSTGGSESQWEMLSRLELSEGAHEALLARCHLRGIQFLSSPFDEGSADLLESLGVPAFKIPSGEITNLPFLAHVAHMGRPLIVSTGMSSLREVDAAVQHMKANGASELVLLHCVSSYPAPLAEVNLRAMQTLERAFGVCVGYSDHTQGVTASVAAVALGACVIEKHFTLSRSLTGPDHQASCEPSELRELVRGIREVELALGHGRKEVSRSEAENLAIARKSIAAAVPIPRGTTIERHMLTTRRPAAGIEPACMSEIVGRCAAADIAENTLLEWRQLS